MCDPVPYCPRCGRTWRLCPCGPSVYQERQCPLHAAATDLLTALQDLVGCMSTNMLDQNDARRHWKNALDVILKATGATP